MVAGANCSCCQTLIMARMWRSPRPGQSAQVRMIASSSVRKVSTVSTGKKGHETPTGVFTILQKNKDHRSNLYDDAPMPYMQRLTWDGIALHSGNLPGYPASHGCVRMPDGFAKRLFAETELGMTVIVSNDKVASPENLLNPAMFAQSMDAEGKLRPVEPLSIYEDYR